MSTKITLPNKVVPMQPFEVRNLTAEQSLVIRCNYFPTPSHVQAFLEGVGCPYGEYLELRQRYRYHIDQLNSLPKSEQIIILNTLGFESAIIAHGTQED